MEHPFGISLDVGSSLANLTGSWRTKRPLYVDRLPPCNNACPAGEILTKAAVGAHRKHDFDRYRNLTACLSCELKPECAPDSPSTRDNIKHIKRWVHEGVLDKMQARLDRLPEAMTIRRQTVEHAFGTLKAWMGATHFLTKTLKNVRTEMSLHVLAYNMKRMINILGVKPLMAAIAA